VPGEALLVKEESFSFEEGVDNATESLKRQLNRYKEKLRT